MFIFGLGYTAGRLAKWLRSAGWAVTGTSRDGRGDTIAFEDAAQLPAALESASHVLSSIPPGDDVDPVLARYGMRRASMASNASKMRCT